jgi:lysozyme family protein
VSKIESIINQIIATEGGYVNNKNDSGGATKYGVTEAVARENGYAGDMRDMPVNFAQKVYYRRYVMFPGFDQVLLLSESISLELIDTGVNMGTATAAKFLQDCLNAFNKRGEVYADLIVDGKIGHKTISALRDYLANRKGSGESVMLKSLNCLQGATYLSIVKARPKDEDFVYGWIKERVSIGQ